MEDAKELECITSVYSNVAGFGSRTEPGNLIEYLELKSKQTLQYDFDYLIYLMVSVTVVEKFDRGISMAVCYFERELDFPFAILRRGASRLLF